MIRFIFVCKSPEVGLKMIIFLKNEFKLFGRNFDVIKDQKVEVEF